MAYQTSNLPGHPNFHVGPNTEALQFQPHFLPEINGGIHQNAIENAMNSEVTGLLLSDGTMGDSGVQMIAHQPHPPVTRSNLNAYAPEYYRDRSAQASNVGIGAQHFHPANSDNVMKATQEHRPPVPGTSLNPQALEFKPNRNAKTMTGDNTARKHRPPDSEYRVNPSSPPFEPSSSTAASSAETPTKNLRHDEIHSKENELSFQLESESKEAGKHTKGKVEQEKQTGVFNEDGDPPKSPSYPFNGVESSHKEKKSDLPVDSPRVTAQMHSNTSPQIETAVPETKKAKNKSSPIKTVSAPPKDQQKAEGEKESISLGDSLVVMEGKGSHLNEFNGKNRISTSSDLSHAGSTISQKNPVSPTEFDINKMGAITIHEGLLRSINKNQDMSELSLSNYEENPSIYEISCIFFGEANVSLMIEQGVDLEIANDLAILLNPFDTTMHYGLRLISKTHTLEKLMNVWIRRKVEYINTESEIINIIGPLEGRRRSLALRNFINKIYFASIWNSNKQILQSHGIKSNVIEALEEYYGISNIPSKFYNIPRNRGNLRRYLPPNSERFLIQTMGLKLSHDRLLLISYLMNKKGSACWWESFNLEDDSNRFGLDILTVLKVGDALQFGCQDGLGQWEKSKYKADEAYAQLISIFLNEENTLKIPWIESSEREWLNNLPGNIYQERLKQLSYLIFNLGEHNKMIFPISNEKLNKHLRGLFISQDDYRLGYELIWLDRGLKLEEFLMKMKNWMPPIYVAKREVQKLTQAEKHALATCLTTFKKSSILTEQKTLFPSLQIFMRAIKKFSPENLFR
ncbi:hypothetical protein VP01_803g3 [Puccinia sorghi]|uniref:Uncharacterized protein n=1 Tax=Puccinia sorghi TaxID=27349 RepID=A0A0L6UAD3_9BASI|nr:hypothetical protein VP01_803g3 [Puccinia sorghi]